MQGSFVQLCVRPTGSHGAFVAATKESLPFTVSAPCRSGGSDAACQGVEAKHTDVSSCLGREEKSGENYCCDV